MKEILKIKLRIDDAAGEEHGIDSLVRLRAKLESEGHDERVLKEALAHLDRVLEHLLDVIPRR